MQDSLVTTPLQVIRPFGGAEMASHGSPEKLKKIISGPQQDKNPWTLHSASVLYQKSYEDL